MSVLLPSMATKTLFTADVLGNEKAMEVAELIYEALTVKNWVALVLLPVKEMAPLLLIDAILAPPLLAAEHMAEAEAWSWATLELMLSCAKLWALSCRREPPLLKLGSEISSAVLSVSRLPQSMPPTK